MFHFRLKPSGIAGAGVGVFATTNISQGTYLRELFGENEVRTMSWSEFATLELPGELKEHFPVRYDDACYLPSDFNRMSVGWYLNHSANPNLAHDANHDYYAIRDVVAGEELLIDYDHL